MRLRTRLAMMALLFGVGSSTGAVKPAEATTLMCGPIDQCASDDGDCMIICTICSDFDPNITWSCEPDWYCRITHGGAGCRCLCNF